MITKNLEVTEWPNLVEPWLTGCSIIAKCCCQVFLLGPSLFLENQKAPMGYDMLQIIKNQYYMHPRNF